LLLLLLRHSSAAFVPFSCLLLPRAPIATLFPYTTLFRSRADVAHPDLRLICRSTHLSPKPSCRSGCAITRSAQPLRQLGFGDRRSEEHTSELQSRRDLVCRLLLEKKKKTQDETDLTKSNI